MVSKIGFSGAMVDADIRSEARAGTEVVRQLAGKARALYELAAGESAVADESPYTSKNPQGETGADLSGPPWGSAIRHPIAWWSWLADDTDVVQPARDLVASNVAGLVIPVVMRWAVWNRPHARTLPGGAIAPYSRAQIWVRGHRTAAGVAATLQGRARNLSLNENAQTEQTQTANGTTATTAEADLFSTSAFFVNLRAGLNDLVLTFLCATANSSIQLDCVGLLQSVKRTH